MVLFTAAIACEAIRHSTNFTSTLVTDHLDELTALSRISGATLTVRIPNRTVHHNHKPVSYTSHLFKHASPYRPNYCTYTLPPQRLEGSCIATKGPDISITAGNVITIRRTRNSASERAKHDTDSLVQHSSPAGVYTSHTERQCGRADTEQVHCAPNECVQSQPKRSAHNTKHCGRCLSHNTQLAQQQAPNVICEHRKAMRERTTGQQRTQSLLLQRRMVQRHSGRGRARLRRNARFPASPDNNKNDTAPR